MNENIVLTEVKNRIGYITMNDPKKLNALSDDMLEGLYQALDKFEKDEDVRCIVLRGAGRAFCPGFDLSPREKPFTTVQDWRRHAKDGNRVCFKIWNCPTPVIAQVHGYCLGGGCDLAAVCDLTIAAEGTQFGEPEIQFNSHAPFVMLPYVLGYKKAKEITLLGDRFSAQEAKEIGLVNRVVPAEELDQAVEALATKIVKVPVPAVQMNKQSINRVYEAAGFYSGILNGEECFSIVLSSPTPESEKFFEIQAKEGLAAAFKWRDEFFANNDKKELQ